MTKPIDFVHEQFTDTQLEKIVDRKKWEVLTALAVEMGFDIARLSTLKYSHIELLNLMIAAWREQSSRLLLCQKAYKKLREQKRKDAQEIMPFLSKEGSL